MKINGINKEDKENQKKQKCLIQWKEKVKK